VVVEGVYIQLHGACLGSEELSPLSKEPRFEPGNYKPIHRVKAAMSHYETKHRNLCLREAANMVRLTPPSLTHRSLILQVVVSLGWTQNAGTAHSEYLNWLLSNVNYVESLFHDFVHLPPQTLPDLLWSLKNDGYWSATNQDAHPQCSQTVSPVRYGRRRVKKLSEPALVSHHATPDAFPGSHPTPSHAHRS